MSRLRTKRKPKRKRTTRGSRRAVPLRTMLSDYAAYYDEQRGRPAPRLVLKGRDQR